MNHNDPLNPNPGDANIEKLLATAYAPEAPAPAFMARVKDAMLEATPTNPAPLLLRPRWMGAWGSIAAVLLVALGIWFGGRMSGPGQPPYLQDGQFVWIDGKAYVPAKNGTLTLAGASPHSAVQPAGLTARPRGEAPQAHRLAIGDTLQTRANERRRTVLPDGSVLFIDQNTSLKLDAQRRLSLSAGQIYLEVSPRDPVASPSSDPTFIVRTPDRTVSALGTRFRVAADGGTSVMVTQGKVKVSGVDLPITAGQQLAPGKDNKPAIQPALRASHELEWTRELIAAAESPLVPDSDYQGGALVVVDPRGQEARLSLRKYHIDVHVEDGFARTTIDQTYFNHENRRLEGTFYFPIPTDASLSRLAMYVEGKLMEGGMAERERAREVFETILYTQRDPALLEWVDGSTFKMRVFPLEPRQEKRLILSYVQKLPESYSRADYRFPGGHTMPIVGHWSFRAFVRNGAALAWNCDSHAMRVTTQGDDLILEAAAERIKPDQDVVIQFTNADPSASLLYTPRFSAANHEGARYLMLRYRPNLPTQPQRERRDWVFIYEASGNRDPLLARAQIDVIRTMLENAEHDDRFAIITAGTRTSAFAAELKPCVPANVTAAVAFLEKTHLVGALDMGRAIDAAVPFVAAAENPYLVHVGTAIPTLGQRRTDLLVGQLPARAKFVGVGVGKNWSRQFMKSAASRTGGYFTQINPDEPTAWRAFELMSTLNTPRLLDIKVTDDAGKAVFLTLNDSVAHGEEVVAIARYTGSTDPSQITLTGRLNGQEISQRLAVDGMSEKADYLPRMWAKLEIDRLVAENPEAHKQRIIDLSKQMYVMSPFTSLLVLEDDAMYEQFKVDRGRKDHWALYPAPAKIDVVYEPDPNNPHAPRKVEPGQRLPKEQVLGTILVRTPPQALVWPGQQHHYGQTLTAWQFFGDIDSDTDRFFRDEDWSGLSVEFSARRLFERERLDLGLKQWGERNDVLRAKDLLSSSEPRLRVMAPAAGPVRVDLISRSEALAISGPALPAQQPMRSSGVAGFGGGRFVQSGVGIDRENRGLSDRLPALNGRVTNTFWMDQDLQMRGTIPLGGTVLLGEKKLESVRGRIQPGYASRNFLYNRPYFSSDWRLFGDLLHHAPGLNTSLADIQAVLEAEAEIDPADAPGQIDPAARKLIDQARAIGWRQATLDAPGRNGTFTLLFDGQGRYTYARTVGEGLRETVISDGSTLWHLYPEIGLGSKRAASRFHQEELAAMVPCFVPAADDLARGADLAVAGERTVVITPRGAAEAKDEKGQPLPYIATHLTFDAEGRLIERRAIEMPSQKVQYVLSISPAGDVKLTDGAGKELRTLKLALAPAQAPSLKADTKGLVVLPMPIRTRPHILATRKLDNNGRFQWSEADALAVAAADMAQSPYELQRLVARRFFARGDRRIGFYILMLAGNRNWDPRTSQDWGDGVRIAMDPVKDHPDSPLARYIADQLRQQQSGHNADVSAGDAKSSAFIERMAAGRYIMNLYQSGRWHQGSEEDRAPRRQAALDFVRTCRDPLLGWGVLTLLANHGGNAAHYEAIAEMARAFEGTAGLGYAARYEAGRALYSAGKYAEAQQAMRTLYEETLASGALPLIDYQFRNVLQWNDSEQWTRLMRQTSAMLLQKHGPTAVIHHAWQIHQVGDQPLAEELFSSALAGLNDEQRYATTLAAVEYLWQTSQHARADAMLQPLLAEQRYAEYSELWRLASAIATGRGMLARALTFEERALELEYAQLPAVVNVQAVRNDYGQLLGRYQQLADAIVTLEHEPPRELLAKVIRFADRWRALDPDVTAACQGAARILQRLGESELAWDYLTTPLADKSNESGPWVNLAQALRQQGDFALADRAYATAFEVEPTNAQVLWDRAQLLQQSQRFDEARQLFRQLAEGTWQPRFQWIQQQSRHYLR